MILPGATLTRRRAMAALFGAGVLLSTAAARPNSPARVTPSPSGRAMLPAPDTGYAHLLGVL